MASKEIAAPLEGVVKAPCSLPQRRLWLSHSLYGQRSSYNIPFLYRLEGALDVGRLQRSLDRVLERHEVLRTFFRLENRDVVQVIQPKLRVPIAEKDLNQMPVGEAVKSALAAAAIDAAIPFDLTTTPLLRATLYRLGDRDHVLAFCVHHIIFDGWSEGILWRELAAFYDADSEACGLEELAIQYADFAIWQRQHRAGDAAESSHAYWKRQLADVPAVLNLPLDAPRPVEPSHRGRLEVMDVPGPVVHALVALGRRYGATLHMMLLAAYSVVLHRYSGDPEVVIGTALAGRTRSEIEPLIGFFINTVAVRADLRGEPTFVDLLERIKRVILESHANQDVPFEAVVEMLHPDRTTGQIPLFQTMFVLQNHEGAPVSLGEATLSPLEVHNGSSKCDLLLSIRAVHDGSSGMACSLEYDTDLFRPATAVRLLESFRSVLVGVIERPNQRIATLPVVSPSERELLTSWGRTPAESPRDSTIHREFAAAAARTPHAIAVSCESESLTYAQLEVRAQQLAVVLRREGVQRGDLVAMCLERGLTPIVAQLAVLKTGAAYLPLDTSYPASRISFIIEDARPRVVLAERRTAEVLPPCDARVIHLDQALEPMLAFPEPWPDEGNGEDLAYVMYTSGSTGRPNGVRVPHRGVLRLGLGSTYVDWRKATTFLQMAPLSFDASTFEVWGPLLNGARLVVFPEQVPTIPRLEQVLREGKVDCLWLTAALFNFVIDERPECLASVRQLIVGGEALSVPHVIRSQARLPFTKLINGYGPTECTTFACCYPIPSIPASATSIPIGRPIANTSVLVLDTNRRVVPVGVVGELYIGGDGVALGYHDRPELTAARFVPDPSGDTGERWYRTGDLVRWLPEGVLDFVGRIDSQVKMRGFRVEPGEIEAVCRRHHAVRDVVVLLHKRTPTDARLVAYVATVDHSAASAADIRQFLEQHLPRQLMPSEIVLRDELPLTPNGKVDRTALLARSVAPAPTGTATADPSAALSAVEQQLLAIWLDVLRVESLSVNDDFFALGGHSLTAVQMFSSIQAAFDRSLPFSALLQHSTVARLARLLEPPVASDVRPSSLVPLRSSGSLPPLFLLPGIGSEVWTFLELVKELDAKQPVFGILPTGAKGAGRTLSISEMAAGFAADIESAYPGGPYILGGYCSGAVTAFEVARQLRLRGKPVQMLVVFDYWLKEQPCGLLAYVRNAALWFADDFMHTSVSNNLGRAKSKARLLRARVRALIGRVGPPPDVRDVLGMWRYPDYEVRRLEDFLKAMQAYRFTGYDGAIHVFRARTRSLGRSQPSADMGWSEIAEGPLTIETVQGAHDSMFMQPFVRSLATRLDRAIRAAEQTDRRRDSTPKETPVVGQPV